MQYDICCQHKLALTPFKSRPAAVLPLLDVSQVVAVFLYCYDHLFYFLLVSVLRLFFTINSSPCWHSTAYINYPPVLSWKPCPVQFLFILSLCLRLVSLYFPLSSMKNAGFHLRYKNAKGSHSSRVHTLSEILGKINYFRAEWQTILICKINKYKQLKKIIM